MKERFFLGMSDIASQISDFKKALEAKGHKTWAVVEDSRSVTQNRKVDQTIAVPSLLNRVKPFRLQRYLKNWYWNNDRLLDQVIDNHDVFLFMWRSIRPDGEDLRKLKAKGKKVVVFFVGSDVRWIGAYEQEMLHYDIPSYLSFVSRSERRHEYITLENKLHYLRKVERYADVIYNLPNQAQLALRPYFHFFVPVDMQAIHENSVQREIPVVVHAPSRRSAKGTNRILAALDRLQAEGMRFEVRLIENMPYERALEEYTHADVVVGELYIPSAGKLDREALAAGCVVLSSMRYDYIDKTPDDCPIIDVNPDTVYEELRKIIPDHTRRSALAKAGRPYVAKYHDIHTITQLLLTRLEQPGDDFDYFPEFFRNSFVPSADNECRLMNHYTKEVLDCQWYKQYIEPGNRQGLSF